MTPPRHEHGAKLFLLSEGARTSFAGVEYVRWHCSNCKAVTLVPVASD